LGHTIIIGENRAEVLGTIKPEYTVCL